MNKFIPDQMPKLGAFIPSGIARPSPQPQCDLCQAAIGSEWAFQFRGYAEHSPVAYVPVCHQCVHRLAGEGPACVVCQQRHLERVVPPLSQ